MLSFLSRGVILALPGRNRGALAKSRRTPDGREGQGGIQGFSLASAVGAQVSVLQVVVKLHGFMHFSVCCFILQDKKTEIKK